MSRCMLFLYFTSFYCVVYNTWFYINDRWRYHTPDVITYDEIPVKTSFQANLKFTYYSILLWNYLFFFIKWRICIDRLKDQKVRTEVWHENCRLESIPCKYMCMYVVCYNKKGYIHAHNSLFWPSLAYYLLIPDSIFFILNTNHIIGKMIRWIWFLC